MSAPGRSYSCLVRCSRLAGWHEGLRQPRSESRARDWLRRPHAPEGVWPDVRPLCTASSLFCSRSGRAPTMSTASSRRLRAASRRPLRWVQVSLSRSSSTERHALARFVPIPDPPVVPSPATPSLLPCSPCIFRLYFLPCPCLRNKACVPSVPYRLSEWASCPTLVIRSAR